MATLFSKIIRGEIPSHRIGESDEFYAFLDIRPVQAGHTLVVPKREVDYFFDLSDEELGRMLAFSKVIAKAIRTATGCTKVGLSVMGLEIDHAHIHLVPISGLGDMDMYARAESSPEALAEVATRIRTALDEQYR